MINLSGLVIDIFDTLRESKLPEMELSEVMTDILISLEENGIIEGNESELTECEHVHPKLTAAIADFLDGGVEYDDDDDPDEDDEY
jgi:hypothetical protein